MKGSAQKCTGVTLAELTIAIVAASILLSVVYFTWNSMSTTTTVRKRRSVLQSECDRIAHLVSGSIRKAEAVLGYDRTSVRLLDADNTDTVTLSFDGTSILRNGRPTGFILPQITVSEFSFENQNGDRDDQPYLFLFRCTLITRQNDTASVQTTVMGRRPGGDGTRQENDFMW